MSEARLDHQIWQPGVVLRIKPASDRYVIYQYSQGASVTMQYNTLLALSEVASIQADLIISIVMNGPRH